MKHEERSGPGPDGTKLHVERWTPDVEPRFVAVVCHGGGEHIGRYARWAEAVTERGGVVFGPDHRGQGSSGGARGHVEHFEDYARDLRHVMLEEAGSHGDALRPGRIPWFLFGHSMGGLIALIYLLEHQRDVELRGAIVSSPLLGLTMKVSPVKVLLGKVASAVAPKLSMPSGIPVDAICRDPEEVARYTADRRRSTVVTAAWFGAMNRAIARASAQVDQIDLPTLWYVGTDDKICDHRATERVFSGIADPKGRDHTLRRFDGYYHELHNEPADLRAPVMEMVLDWIEARL